MLKLIVVMTLCVRFSHENVNVTTQRKLDCGAIFTTKQFVIESPGYPNGYEENLDCAFLFKGDDCPSYYNLQFLDFDLERSLGCTKDRLEVENKDALCGAVVGIKNYYAPRGVLQLKFVSDGQIRGRGFRILVTRLPCNDNPSDVHETETTTASDSCTMKPESWDVGQQAATNQFCCANSYNTKRFIISSPGFPYSNNNPSDCVYHIHKASNNVCRLRMHFLFYWNGLQGSSGCEKGFLQIDGKNVCGCRVGLKLISAFDARWDNAPKVIRFKNEGFPNSVFSGFAIEVVQDECPRRYTPREQQEKFHHYNDQSNTVAWPHLNGSNTSSLQNQSRDVEETTYIDTSNPNPFLPNGNDDYKCRMWGVLQWTLLAKETSWQKCVANKIPVTQKCVDLDMHKGFMQSPGYPYYYPGNLNLCYRFTRQRGFCSIKLYMVDFDVEDSYQCMKDYLLVGTQYRYCGRSLQNTYSTLDLTYKSNEDLHFVTDNIMCGRGFRGYYEQIPCAADPPPDANPPPVNPLPCDRRITDEFFTLEVHGYHQTTCNFNVVRSNPEVCRLEITFDSFDLPCDSEYLLIDNRRYCGLLSGRRMSFAVNFSQVSIVYRRIDNSLPGLRLKLTVRQISANCGPVSTVWELAAGGELWIDRVRNVCDDFFRYRRQLKPPRTNNSEFRKLNNSLMDVVKHSDQDYEFILNNDYADVCGIIMELKKSMGADNLCDALLKGRSNLECVSLTPDTIYVPYDANKIELTVDDADMIDELYFKEVLCSDI